MTPLRTAITLTAAAATVLFGSLLMWVGVVLTAAGVIYSVLGAIAETRADDAHSQPAPVPAAKTWADHTWLDPHETWYPRGELTVRQVREEFAAIVSAEWTERSR